MYVCSLQKLLALEQTCVFRSVCFVCTVGLGEPGSGSQMGCCTDVAASPQGEALPHSGVIIARRCCGSVRADTFRGQEPVKGPCDMELGRAVCFLVSALMLGQKKKLGEW